MTQRKTAGVESAFCSTLKAYARTALAHLGNCEPAVDPSAIEDRPELLEWTEASGQRRCRHRDRLLLEDKLHQLSQYRNLIEAMETDSVVGSVVGKWVAAGGISTYIDATDIADEPIRQVAAHCGTFECDEHRLDIVCRAVEGRLRSATVDQTLVGVLFGFDSERVPLPLAGGVQIDALNEEELWLCEYEGFVGRWAAPRFGVRYRRALPRAVGNVDIVHETSDDALAFQTEGYALIERVLEALRVFQAGAFASPGDFRYSWLQNSPEFRIAFDQRSRFLEGYHLDAAQADSFSTFFELYASLPSESPIGLALRRFVQAGEASRTDDRLVDLVTAAEALFLKGIDAELKYRLSIRFAQFCETDGYAKPELYEFMKRAYSTRSRIVHGETAPTWALEMESPKGEAMPLYAFVSLLEDMLRSCFWKALRLVASCEWPPAWETALLEAWDQRE